MILKFLCVSDTHGDVPPKASEQGVTAWLHAGDFWNTGAENLDDAGRRRLQSWSAARRIPVYVVQGNHDCGAAVEILGRCATDVTGKFVPIAPRLFLAGIGWSGQSFCDTPDETSLRAICAQVLASARLQQAAEDRCILLTHYPAKLYPPLFPFSGDPKGFLFDCVREMIEMLRPIAVVQGHIHGWQCLQAVHAVGNQPVRVINASPDGGMLTVNLEDGTATYQPWLEEE